MSAAAKALDALEAALERDGDQPQEIEGLFAEALAAVARAAMSWRYVFSHPPKLRTDHHHRAYSHAVAHARGKLFAALDALEAAAAEGGGA